MDEKERLNSADTEIRRHTEQDKKEQDTAVPDCSELALFLAKSYGQMLKDREQLQSCLMLVSNLHEGNGNPGSLFGQHRL